MPWRASAVLIHTMGGGTWDKVAENKCAPPFTENSLPVVDQDAFGFEQEHAHRSENLFGLE